MIVARNGKKPAASGKSKSAPTPSPAPKATLTPKAEKPSVPAAEEPSVPEANPGLPLEQQRVLDAWRCAQNRDKGYMSLAREVPALIMNSGLLQVLAFLYEKSAKPEANPHHGPFGEHLRAWLLQRFPQLFAGQGGQAVGASRGGFVAFMQALMRADPVTYRDVTTEALAWLRWMRQVGPAVQRGPKEES